jgi:hypothetical protein
MDQVSEFQYDKESDAVELLRMLNHYQFGASDVSLLSLAREFLHARGYGIESRANYHDLESIRDAHTRYADAFVDARTNPVGLEELRMARTNLIGVFSDEMRQRRTYWELLHWARIVDDVHREVSETYSHLLTKNYAV